MSEQEDKARQRTAERAAAFDRALRIAAQRLADLEALGCTVVDAGDGHFDITAPQPRKPQARGESRLHRITTTTEGLGAALERVKRELGK